LRLLAQPPQNLGWHFPEVIDCGADVAIGQVLGQGSTCVVYEADRIASEIPSKPASDIVPASAASTASVSSSYVCKVFNPSSQHLAQHEASMLELVQGSVHVVRLEAAPDFSLESFPTLSTSSSAQSTSSLSRSFGFAAFTSM
jgi:hypothetical protein